MFGASEVEVSGHHVHVAVEQPGENRLSSAVHNVITVQIGPDIDDVAAFDDEVGYACCGSVEHGPILEDCADCHCSSFHECSTAQAGRGGADAASALDNVDGRRCGHDAAAWRSRSHAGGALLVAVADNEPATDGVVRVRSNNNAGMAVCRERH
ncbi:hypothetical protein SMALB_5654 [Streptomyces malaysiensis]|uniref:Uncharacterized protein n=1 Tax=Streptomyces malaysiensis TaxID=92644 RepID=A0A7X6AZ86_STRMQ|nr:hypothetical protein [Streptomyces malaysiensis]